MSQNYKRLGLSSRLNAAAGGKEKKRTSKDDALQDTKRDSLAIAGSRAAITGPQEVQVERDPETGRIIRVITAEDGAENDNPLNDPLNDTRDYDDEDSEPRTQNDVIAALEAQAAQEEALLTQKRPRRQSQREEEWIGRLVDKHGDDIKAMVRDRKLNPMQQAEGDIRRRVKKWKANHGEVST